MVTHKVLSYVDPDMGLSVRYSDEGLIGVGSDDLVALVNLVEEIEQYRRIYEKIGRPPSLAVRGFDSNRIFQRLFLDNIKPDYRVEISTGDILEVYRISQDEVASIDWDKEMNAEIRDCSFPPPLHGFKAEGNQIDEDDIPF